MKIEHIKEFLILAEELNFTAAAKRLYLAQPALSKHLATLEDELGVRLVDRSTHMVALTEAGSAAASYFEKVVNAYDKAIGEIKLRADGYSRQIRLGFLLHALDDNLYMATDQIAQRAQSSKVDVVFREADELIDALVRDEVDACLMMDFHFPGDEAMTFDTVGVQSRSVLVLEDDPLANHDVLHYADLVDRTFVFPLGEGDSSSRLVASFEAHGLPEPSYVFSTQKSTQVFTMREVNGIAVVSSEMHKRVPKGVRMIPLDEADAFAQVCWVYRADKADLMLKELLGQATEVLRESGEL